MIGNQGIDADVAARMDAYRGNPQALMQKYQQNQQLIDLLALQKLKSEKEAAAREMQMQMAQQQQAQGGLPTIAQQREQEVMQMTKDELAKQTGATLGQKQQQAQRNMQGLAQAASRPGARPNPMAGGIASAPSAGMTRMAGGGIVAFANGGLSEMDEETRKRVEAGMYRYQGGGAQQYLKSAKKLQDQADQLQNIAPERAANMRAQAEGLIKMAMQLPEMKQLEQAAPAARVRGLMAEAENEPMIPGTSIFGSSPEEAAGFQAEAKDLFAGMQASPSPQARQEAAKLQEERPGLFGASPAPTTPDMEGPEMEGPTAPTPAPAPEGIAAAMPQQQAAPDELADLRKATREGIMSRIKGDPEKERREALKQFLIGAGGKTSLAGALAGGSQAARRYETGQEAERAKALELGQAELGTASKERIADLDREAYIAINKESSLNKKIEMANDLQKAREKAIYDFYEATYNLGAMAAAQGDAKSQNAVDQIKAQRDSEVQAAREKFKKEVDMLRAGAPLTAPSAPGNWTVKEK